MFRRIYRFEAAGKAALGFDTGLDSRAFAQAKAAQFITEPGLILYPGGGAESWKASGVIEHDNSGSMLIWGPPFKGERLDLLISDNTRRDEALAAVTRWIEARFLLGEQCASLRPFAALIAGKGAADSSGTADAASAVDGDVAGEGVYPPGTMFFTPESLTLRCLQAEGADARICGGEWYVHPDLTGMEAAVFTAGAMLYRVLSGTVPYPARDEELLHQDMREGNVPPIRLAAPGLDERLASLIQAALVSAEKTSGPADRIPRSGTALLSQLLAILKPEGRAVSGAASLFHQLSAEEQLRLAKEKDQFLKRKNLAVKTRRFVIRNTAIIAGCAAAVLIAVLMVRSVVKSRADRPTTAGMDSAQVVHSYYGAFGGLDHQLMEACVIQGAGKGDIEMVTNLFVISRVRQAYEMRGSPPLITAAEWQNAGAEPLDSQVFGVTGLEIERLSGDESAEAVRYRAVYTLWLPRQYGAENAVQEDAGSQEETAGLPVGVRYTDELTLIKNRGNWRIAEIHRAQIPR